MNNKLPAYRITHEFIDGHTDSYVTSMAKGITLADAKAYFMGQEQEIAEMIFATVIDVEEITVPSME